MEMTKTGDVIFLEHRKSVRHEIWHQIRIPRPSFTRKPLKSDCLLHGNVENRHLLFLELLIVLQNSDLRFEFPALDLTYTQKKRFYSASCAQKTRSSIF